MTISEQDLADAVRFRTAFGLRADEPWVRVVAMDPASKLGRTHFGVPLLPFERLDLLSRQNDPDLAQVVERYGRAYPDEFVGVFFDQQAGAVLVATFQDRVPRHRTALMSLLPGVELDVREVDWNLDELQSFRAIVEADRGWFETIGTKLVTIDEPHPWGEFEVRFEGPDPDAAGLIESHFGNPSWLQAEWDGPLPWTGPRGDLVVVVSDDAGRPVPDLWVDFTPEDMNAVRLGETFFGTGPDGQMIAKDIPAVSYSVVIKGRTGGDQWTVLHTTRATVRPGGPAVVKAVVADP